MIFVESFISQTVIGMVKSLQGVGDIETVACTCGYLATGGAGTGDGKHGPYEPIGKLKLS